MMTYPTGLALWLKERRGVRRHHLVQKAIYMVQVVRAQVSITYVEASIHCRDHNSMGILRSDNTNFGRFFHYARSNRYPYSSLSLLRQLTYSPKAEAVPKNSNFLTLANHNFSIKSETDDELRLYRQPVER